VLAGQPAGIVEELEIDLPRPRNQLTTREMPRFLELRHALHTAIQGAGNGNGHRSGDDGGSA
jgi:NitT/TauT family transport system ATP-binding protein